VKEASEGLGITQMSDWPRNCFLIHNEILKGIFEQRRLC
jgi:hypothetical protein